jgi:hypothetical protein
MTKQQYLARLRRIEGQVLGLQRQIEEDTYCIDVLQQIPAVNGALQNVAIGLLDEHVGYGDPRGNARLREVLCGWLATTRGVRTDPDGIIVVAGQRAIAVEDPGSRGARDELAHWGLQ